MIDKLMFNYRSIGSKSWNNIATTFIKMHRPICSGC